MFRSILLSFALACCFTMLPGHAQAGEPSSAIEAFKKSHESVLKLVKTKADDGDIQKRVDAFLDYQWLAEASLGGAKRSERRCEPRCPEFEALLAKLIRQNYLKRIHQADNGTVAYVGEEVRKNGTKAKVDTKVEFTKNGRKEELKISYVMALKDDTWVCQNIITDGVSLAKTYKYEFNKILRDEGIDGLIARLESKLAELAKAP